MAEVFARSDQFKFRSKEPPAQAGTWHWVFPARRGRFAGALLLLVASVSLCAVAQTAPSNVSAGPRGRVTQELFPITLRGAGETSAFNNGAAVENGADPRRVIVIGFVGGFARCDDQGHPEVQFAEYLRDRYRHDVDAEVFRNHDGKKALHEVLRLLDGGGNGSPSSAERSARKNHPLSTAVQMSAKQWLLLESWESAAFQFSSPSSWTASKNRAVTIPGFPQTWQMLLISISRGGRFRGSRRSSQPIRLRRRSSEISI